MDLSALASSSSTYSTTQLLNQIGQQIQKNAQQKAQAVGDTYSQKISALSNSPTVTNAKNAQTSITNAVSTLQSTINRLQQMDTVLVQMDGLASGLSISGLNTDTTTLQFDAQWNVLRSLAQSGGGTSDNLLGTVTAGGDYRSGSLEYKTATGGTVTVFGSYVGSDYKVNMSDGSFWMTSGTQTMQRYQAYPYGTVGNGVSTSPESLKLNGSYSDSNVSFTTGVNLASSGQQTYQGNVTREGLGVLNAWAYNNFSTASDAARAESDITHARSQISDMLSQMTGALALAQNEQQKAQNLQTSIQSQVSNLQNQAQSAMQQVSADAQRQFNAIQASLSQTMTTADSTSQLSGLFSALVPPGQSATPNLNSSQQQDPQQLLAQQQQAQIQAAMQSAQNPYGGTLGILGTSTTSILA